jgi:hypothetical protein
MNNPNSSSTEAARLALTVIALTTAGQPVSPQAIQKLYELSGLQEPNFEKNCEENDEPVIFSLAKFREKKQFRENAKNRENLSSQKPNISPFLKIYAPENAAETDFDTPIFSVQKTVPKLKIFAE